MGGVDPLAVPTPFPDREVSDDLYKICQGCCFAVVGHTILRDIV